MAVFWSAMIACLAEGHEAPVPVADDFVGTSLQLVLDEPQQVLLVHACRVMHVGVHLFREVSSPRQPKGVL